MPEELETNNPDTQESEEVNTSIEPNEDEDSVSDDPIGDTSDDAGEAEEPSGKSKDTSEKIDPVTRAILAEREAASYKERLSYLERQTLQAKNQVEEQERLNLMSDAERAQYYFQKTQEFVNTNQQELNRKLQFASFDMTDRSNFVSKFSHHPAYNKYSSQVEAKYTEAAGKGNPVSREDVFAWILGQKQKEALLRGVGTKQRNKGATNITKAKSNGAAGKSDFQKSAAPKGNDIAAIKARLMAGRSSYGQ